jgi:hypothetical protein
MIIKHPVPGTLIIDGDKAALRLGAAGDAERVYLAYALVTQGPELQVLPSVLLDDWGNEVSDLALFDWIGENGLRFPRAEIFGESPTGAPVQYFLRDLELFGRYPVYAYLQPDAPAGSGVLLRAVLLPGATATDPAPADPPADVGEPLRRAQVEWWRVGPRVSGLEFLA